MENGEGLMDNPQQQGHPALKWGLIFGGVLALISLANSGIQYATGAYSQMGDPVTAQAHMGTNFLVGCGGFLVEVAIYFFTGMLASRENGRVGTGALAGLIAAAVGTIIGGIVAVVVLANVSLTPPANSGLDPAQFASLMHTIIVAAAVLGILIGLGFGTGIAALGGLVGRGRYEASHPLQPGMGSMYAPMGPGGAPYPYGGAPGAYPPPAAPGYYPPSNPATGAPYQYPPAPYPPAPPASYAPDTNQPAQTPQQLESPQPLQPPQTPESPQ